MSEILGFMLYSSNYDIKMSLDASTRDILEKDTQSATNGSGVWDSAWLNMLTTLFPFTSQPYTSQPYSVFPRKRNGARGDLILEVARSPVLNQPIPFN